MPNLNKNKEELLSQDEKRYNLFPIKYPDIMKHYKNALQCFWTVEEVELKKDRTDWEKLSENERSFVEKILAFFAGSDGIVMENLALRFMNDIVIAEAKLFYGFQITMEGIHSEMYSLLIDALIKDSQKKNELFNAIKKIPCVKNKADWALKWINNKEDDFGIRLIAFAIVEGIFFSASFCSIYWLKERGLMPGLTFSNELISRDEGLHTDFACLLHSMLQNKPKQKTVHEIVNEAVLIEKNFITKAIPCNMIGMNTKLMEKYIEFVADRLLVQLNYDKLYNSKNPFDFMETISLRGKANFFEKKQSNYIKAGVGKSEEDNDITISDDF